MEAACPEEGQRPVSKGVRPTIRIEFHPDAGIIATISAHPPPFETRLRRSSGRTDVHSLA